MGKLLKVTLEFEDRVISLEGEKAEEWRSVFLKASLRGRAFDWKIVKKGSG